jgi:saccharopine dehydrogenase-like NADP-dependent oxidoreductase
MRITRSTKTTRKSWKRLRRDDGMSTVEYTLGTLAACAFAVILYKVITSPMVQNALSAVLRKALSTSF